MKQVCSMLNKLIDKTPLSAITENDFAVETPAEGKRTAEILRCTRYPHLYKMDGQYYDDRAVAFRRKDTESDAAAASSTTAKKAFPWAAANGDCA
jgi:hypothetical protein